MLTTLILGFILLVMFVGALVFFLNLTDSILSEGHDHDASGKLLKENDLSEKDKEAFRLAEYEAFHRLHFADPLDPWRSFPFLF